VVEMRELLRGRRRPRPLKQLDPRARLARLALEREIYRPRLVIVTLRLTADQIEKIDAERRIATSAGGVPSRCAAVRALIDDGFALRKIARPKEPPRREPFPIDTSWPKDLLR
jgi:hypothetical protein